MIGKILITIYSIILSLIALACIAITWANDPAYILIIETLVNLVIVVGCWLTLSTKQHKSWVVLLIIAFTGEAYLLNIDSRVGIKETIQWVVILLPALFLNLKAAGIVKNKELLKEKIA